MMKIILCAEGQALMGGRQTIKLRSEDTNGRMSVISSVIPAGTGIPTHIHSREDEIFEMTEGELELTVNGEVHVLKKGDMAFLPKGQPHGFKAVQDASMWVTLVPGGAENMFVDLAALPPGAPDMNEITRIALGYGIKFTG
jgi:quercetin dioxygenase-like cupin family protein